MSLNASPERSTTPDAVTYRIRLTGANGASPANDYAPGCAVTRTGEGAYTITWPEAQGTFVGWRYGFGATTPADLKGYTAVRGTYSTTAFTLAFVVYDSTFAAADIIVAQNMDIEVTFKTTAV